MEPAPAEDWLGLARKIESALQGQPSLSPVPAEVERATRRARQGKKAAASSELVISVDANRVEIEEAREAGPVHVGQFESRRDFTLVLRPRRRGKMSIEQIFFPFAAKSGIFQTLFRALSLTRPFFGWA
jgi:hypothetical protein